MSIVQVYDRAMCCSTGVCGPRVDPALPRFAADLDWLKQQGHDVMRFNLAQDPAEFARHPDVQQMIESEGIECLPMIIVDGQVVSRGEYSTRERLALWTESPRTPPATLPVVSNDDGCCGENDCC